MNWEWWLEITNRKETTVYCVVKHVSYCMWVLWRVTLPCYLVYGLCRYAIPEHGGGGCFLMSYLTGIIIFVFCIAVFTMVMTVSLLKFHGCIKEVDHVTEPRSSQDMSLQDTFSGLRESLNVLAWERRIATSPTAKQRMQTTVRKIQRAATTIGLLADLDQEKLEDDDIPVSYTHLRAHETPEHLVCRLLLEKKKKKTATNSKTTNIVITTML
eukprot:TRINITY_DN6494_c0_g1_i5.p2 TRINITY_DN6494_c0_g1~~TRINITY_DN6494_c0_g1_i5.p2  ORF type:complete len:213 (-),score=50.06 TRINITY_DN6494_c0_g1_i5:18-656(-)